VVEDISALSRFKSFAVIARNSSFTYKGRAVEVRQVINLSQAFAGQNVGIKQVNEHIWLASFMQYDSGYIDDGTCRLGPLQKTLWPKVLPMSPQ